MSASDDGSGANPSGTADSGMGDPSDSSTSSTSDSHGASDPSEGGAPPGTGTASPGTDDGPVFDVPQGVSAGDDGVTPAGGCRIDFLFVIDSSCSIENDQPNIEASLPGFISTIETRFGEHDHHIMVVDTDEVAGDEWTACRASCAIGLNTFCGATPCSALPPNDPCNSELGLGLDNRGVSCNFLGGNRYMIDGQPDLAATFDCAASNRNTTGLPDEKAAGAILAAISPRMNGPGGCNAGFLRRDAILVITLITDEEDDPRDHVVRQAMDDDFNSLGDPATWKQTIVDLKNGDENAVVMLGILGDSDLAGSGIASCPPLGNSWGENPGVEGAEAAHRLRQLADSFPKGMWAGICEENYAPFFEQAVSVIDTACQEFVPPPPE